MTLNEIVEAYIQDYREGARCEMVFFETQRSLASAIRHSALCRLPSGKRHPHQRRIPHAVLEQAERSLQAIAATLKRASDFAALYGIVNETIGPIRGIGRGRLTVYDVAHRIGAFLGKAPTLVYLHAGTKAGAAVLGFGGEAIHPNVLPPAFSRLSAAEIEDCLCIYKSDLRGGTIRTGDLQRSTRCNTARLPRARRC
jgi:hypothetical protein